MEQYDISKSLTESNLGYKLTNIFSKEFIHNRKFIVNKFPDYRNDDLKLIVEYDGPYHFKSSKRIVEYEERDSFYFSNGYKTVRIPMFIQLNTGTIKDLFGIYYEMKNEYPSGFIVDLESLLLPCGFCELGIMKFRKYLETVPSARQEIIDSLKVKIEKLGNINKVLPPSLHFLVK